MLCLIAGCLGGLEELVVEDLKEAFGQAILDIKVISEQPVKIGEAACGKVWISLTSVSVKLESIRSVQFWLVALYQGELCGDGLLDALPLINSHINHASLTQALDIWKSLLPSDNSSSDPNFSFWAKCVRSGEHKFTSVDLASSLGRHIKDTMQWRVDVKEPCLTVSVIVAYKIIAIGFLLPIGAKASPKSHLPVEVHPPVLQVPHSTNLRPSTAYIMLKLARMQPFEVVVDAMCGPGAGFLEGAFGHRGVGVGGDVNTGLKAPLLQAVKVAAEMSNNKAIAEALNWTFKRCPLRSDSVDVGFIDIPFRKVGPSVPVHLRARFGQIVREFARILRVGSGRCVLLTQTHEQLVNCLKTVYFTDIQCIPVNIDGLLSYIVLACRSSEEFVCVKEDMESGANKKDGEEHEGGIGTKRKLES